VNGPIGVLVMAYGTASGPDDVERYYTDIRGGRRPPPQHLEELRARYAAIGDRFPLLEITREQAEGIGRELNEHEEDDYVAFIGMKHSPPTIEEAVASMTTEGIDRAVGIVMAPHWSGMSVETYIDRVQAAAGGEGPAFAFVRGFHDDPGFIQFLAARVTDALAALPEDVRGNSAVVFTAHSLPVRTEDDGSQRCVLCRATVCATACRYHDGLGETAELVAADAGVSDWATAWQSVGRTDDPWWGPPLEEVISDLARAGRAGLVVCPAGFVSDHLEILYDVDIEARRVAEDAGMAFVRTQMPNADPEFVRVLAHVARQAFVEEFGR
jgi:protoporphyrin/coproporphyrin ferrochelatase